MQVVGYILIVTFFSFGWCALFNEGMILENLGRLMDAKLPTWLKKPLYDCPKCNSFWVWTALYWSPITHPMAWWYWPLIGGCAIGVTDIILSIQNNIKHISEAIDEHE